MHAPEQMNAARVFGLALSRSLTPKFSKLSERRWVVTVSGETPPAREEAMEALYFKFRLSGALDGYAILMASMADIAKLSFKSLPDGPNTAKEQQTAAFLKALEATADELSKDLLEHVEVGVEVESVELPELPKGHRIELYAETEDQKTRASFLILCDPVLLSSLKMASPKMASLSSPSDSTAENLDLVLDVELNVTLRFGQRQLSLREVLDLTSGSVVELDRQVDEPVELVLDGRVVARGEAVIIDGNYGMRITQVLQRLVA